MKRLLRHPINAIREPFGTAGLIVAMIALVAALGGTAFAAAKLNSTQKKEVEKIAKKYAGKPGAPGANGTNGAPGAKGDAGAPGSNGANGKSVLASAASTTNPGGECPTVGGTKFEVEGSGSPSHVCNGKNGTTGFTDTLPSEKTETGAWGGTVGKSVGGVEKLVAPISFTIPLESAIPGTEILIKPEGYDGTDNTGTEHEECPGKAEEPKAASGKLCIYTSFSNETTPLGKVVTVNTAAGVVFVLACTNAAEEGTAVYGTWAVTAP